MRIRRARRKRSRPDTKVQYRRNRQIRSQQVMLIDQTDKQIGVIDTRDALQMAYEAELDLVEVSPNARPPVARILDYSKFIYERKRKEREARKNQKKIETKTIKLKLKTADFHRGIQIKKARRWLLEEKKVKVEIRFFGREITYPELGYKIMTGVVEELKELSTVEQRARLDGRNMIMYLAPLEGAALRKAQEDNAKAQGKDIKPDEDLQDEDDIEEDLDKDDDNNDDAAVETDSDAKVNADADSDVAEVVEEIVEEVEESEE